MTWGKALILLMKTYFQADMDNLQRPPEEHTCIASVFGYEDDEHKGGEAICVHRNLRPDEIGIASRDLPCGAKVMLINPRNGRKVVARVVDHGPFGAKVGRKWVIKRKETDPGIWRGCLDITRQTQKVLRHNGFEELTYYSLR